MHGALIDVNFLLSVWPEFLRGVRLLIVNCRDYHIDGPLAGTEVILPETWTIIGDAEGTHRDVVLKLSGNHFTLLRPTDPTHTDPIRRLQQIAHQVGFNPPRDISHFMSEPFEGDFDEESLQSAREAAITYQAIEESE
jgi:hypothetical protein